MKMKFFFVDVGGEKLCEKPVLRTQHFHRKFLPCWVFMKNSINLSEMRFYALSHKM